MTDPRRPTSRPAAPDDLDAALADLGPRVAFPPTPDLAGAVRRRVAARPVAARPAWLPTRPRVALAGLALLLLIGATLTLSRDLRSAVADRLGIGGIRIEVVDEPPTTSIDPTTPPLPPVGVTLLLGEPMSLAEARAAVPYTVRVPATLGPPDEVYVRRLTDGPMVTLVYRPRPGLPAAAETGVGALLMQFPARADGGDIAKKVLSGQGDLTETTVGGEYGYWITGASELFILPDPAATIADAPGRPSANVLIWAVDGITYRLETALPLEAALLIAESLTGPDPATPTTPRSDVHPSRLRRSPRAADTT